MYEVVLWSISLVTCVESRGGETRTRDARPSTGAEHTQYKSSHKSVTIVKRLIVRNRNFTKIYASDQTDSQVSQFAELCGCYTMVLASPPLLSREPCWSAVSRRFA